MFFFFVKAPLRKFLNLFVSCFPHFLRFPISKDFYQNLYFFSSWKRISVAWGWIFEWNFPIRRKWSSISRKKSFFFFLNWTFHFENLRYDERCCDSSFPPLSPPPHRSIRTLSSPLFNHRCWPWRRYFVSEQRKMV